MPAQIDLGRSVTDLVLKNPARASVLDRFCIDYCCGGRATLALACAVRGLEAWAVMAALAAADSATVAGGCVADWRSEPCGRLVEHIVGTHHAFLRRELPAIVERTGALAAEHAAAQPRLAGLHGAVNALKSELESHLEKEEQILFPNIRRLAQGMDSPFASIAMPMTCMEHEHEGANAALGRIRALTAGVRAPEGATEIWDALLRDLQALESDLHLHIHEENNVLFPRALATERSVRGGGNVRSAV